MFTFAYNTLHALRMDSSEKHDAVEQEKSVDLVFQLPELNSTSYQNHSLENLVGELQRLLKNAPIQKIAQHVNAIKQSFDTQFKALLLTEKERFLEQGNAEMDFEYNPLIKRQFEELYHEYRDKKTRYRKEFERQLQENLKKKQAIIESIKALLEAEENINDTFQSFKDLQAEWRATGMVPKTYNDDLWANYHHHVERFYDFLDLNRELRDRDFKHNYEEKLKIIDRAEALIDEPDFKKAYTTLQELHRIWKEELGPVSKEVRQEVWERFSAATKKMHDKKQQLTEIEDQEREKHLIEKKKVLEAFEELASTPITSQKQLNQNLKLANEIKDSFYAVGSVPRKEQKALSNRFRALFKSFNQQKNAFYKEQKKSFKENLAAKRRLIEQVEALKDHPDFKTTTPVIKELQGEWKKIGHVPRKYSEPLWEAFRGACNHYFERLKAQTNTTRAKQQQSRKELSDVLEQIETFSPSKNRDEDFQRLAELKTKLEQEGRTASGQVANKAEKALNKAISGLGLDENSFASELHTKRIASLKENATELSDLHQTRAGVRNHINRLSDEIRLLETNLEFFSSSDPENPLLKEARSKIALKSDEKEQWTLKLKELNVIKNRIEKEGVENRQESSEETTGENDSRE